MTAILDRLPGRERVKPLLWLALFAVLNQLAFSPILNWFAAGEYVGQSTLLSRLILYFPTALFLAIAALAGPVDRTDAPRRRTRVRQLALLVVSAVYAILVVGFFGSMMLLTYLIKSHVVLIMLAATGIWAASARMLGLRLLYAIAGALVLISFAFTFFIDLLRTPDDGLISEILAQDAVRELVVYGTESPTTVRVSSSFFTEAPPSDGEPVVLRLTGHPHSFVQYLAFDPSGRYLFGSGKGHEGLSFERGRFYPLFRIDLKTGGVDVIPLPVPSMGIAYSSDDDEHGALWVGNEGGIGFFRIGAGAFDDPVAYLSEMRAFGKRPRNLRVGESFGLYHWFPAEMDIEGFVVDRESSRLLVFFEDADPSHLDEARGLSIWELEGMRDGRSIFFSGADQLVRSPLRRVFYSQIQWIPPGLTELDYDTLRTVRTMFWPVGNGFDVHPETGDIFLVDMMLGRLHRIDPEQLESTDSVFLGIGLKLVVYDAHRDLLYVGNYFTGEFHVVSWRELTVLATVQVGQRNRSIVVLPVNHRVVTNTSCGVFEIDVDRLIGR